MTDSFVTIVVAALEAEGQSAVHTSTTASRGYPPEWQMSMPLDRADIETRFDLGPLAWWFMGPGGEWVLKDSLTQVTLRGTGASPPYDGTRRPPGGGRPLAHVADSAELRQRWVVPTPDDEVGVLDARAVSVRGPNLVCRIQVDRSPDEVLTRVRDVLSVVLAGPADPGRRAAARDLPDWFVAACAPHRTPDEWTAWARDAYADPPHIRLRRWEARWTLEAWLRAMVPSERTWWLAEATAISDDAVRVSILRPSDAAPVASLSWLLHVAGASGCRPTAAPPVRPLAVPVLPASQHRDPDDALAAAAHDLLGLADPLVLDTLADTGGYTWEHRIDVPIDTVTLERELPADSDLTYGSNARASWLTNGASTVYGAVPVVEQQPRNTSWWR